MIKVASIFSQVLREVPRAEIFGLVKKHEAEYGAKGFSCWDQFVAMVFSPLSPVDSLREIEHGLAACVGKLVHVGMRKAPPKSTLAYANEHRPAAMYADLFDALLNHFSALGLHQRKKKFRFKNRLLSLDATVISLCLNLFPWAEFRRAKGGVKMHVLLDHDVYKPRFVRITEARCHEATVAAEVPLPAESVVAMDRGYTDYTQYEVWTRQRIRFVTRMKENAAYEVVERREVPKNRSILTDAIIRLTGPKAPKDLLLRRIVVWNEEKQEELVLLTNHLEFGATTIAAIYKERWEIEIFFKELKQTLKIKTSVGTSSNAVAVQIWTALIALLILKWLHFRSTAGLSFSNLAGVLRLILFTYRDLEEWLRKPFETPPHVPEPVQLLLFP
jgi:hypothetical protein